MKKQHKEKRRKQSVAAHSPVIKFRTVLATVVVAFLGICGPLFVVWKQAKTRNLYLEQSSLRARSLEARAHVDSLQKKVLELSDRSRIESIARQQLGLLYPSSDKMAFIDLRKNKKQRSESTNAFVKLLEKSFDKNESL